jgi:hypothetical protein
VACSLTAKQQPWNKQLNNSRYHVLALQRTAVARQWLNSDHPDMNTTTALQKKKVFSMQHRKGVINTIMPQLA